MSAGWYDPPPSAEGSGAGLGDGVVSPTVGDDGSGEVEGGEGAGVVEGGEGAAMVEGGEGTEVVEAPASKTLQVHGVRQRAGSSSWIPGMHESLHCAQPMVF